MKITGDETPKHIPAYTMETSLTPIIRVTVIRRGVRALAANNADMNPIVDTNTNSVLGFVKRALITT